MSTRARIAIAAVVVVAIASVAVFAVGRRSPKHETAPPSPATSRTRPVTSTTVRAATSTAPKTKTTTSTSTPTPIITLPPPFTDAQLELALLQSADLPIDSRRDVVRPSAWVGVCGSTPPNAAAPISAAAVDFNGSNGLHIREDLADYGSRAGRYLDAVRARISCATYVPNGGTGQSPTTVVPISASVVANTLDTTNGAEGIGVKTIDGAGNASFHVWVRQGDLVISLQDDARTATAVSAVQFAQLALERMKNTLA
jgi:hypothetical protein